MSGQEFLILLCILATASAIGALAGALLGGAICWAMSRILQR